MQQWTRREVLEVGSSGVAVAVSPKWVEASTEPAMWR